MVEDKKEILANKAAELFLKHGYHNVSMQKLAQEVGLQAPALYYYFKSKEDILVHLEEVAARRFEDYSVPISEAADPEEKIVILIRNVIRLIVTYPAINLLMTYRQWPQKTEKLKKKQERRFVQSIRTILTDLIKKKGISSPVDPILATFCLIGMTSWVWRWYHSKGRIKIEELTEDMTRLFFNGFYAGQARLNKLSHLFEIPTPTLETTSSKDKKQCITRKATELFLSEGYHKASMRQLAEAAGLQAPAIYYYFKSKEQLLQYIEDESATRFRENVIDPVSAIKDPEEKMEVLIRKVIFLFLNSSEAALLMSRVSSSKKAERLKAKKAREHMHLMRVILQELVETKDIKTPVDSTVATFSLIGMTSWIHKWYRPEGNISLEKLVQDVTRLFFLGFYADQIQSQASEGRPEMTQPQPIMNGIMALPPTSIIPYLIGGRCSRCGKISFPKREMCSECFNRSVVEDIRLSSRGKIVSYTVVRRGLGAGKHAYALGYVELPEKITLLAPLAEKNFERLTIGMDVEAVFEEEIGENGRPVIVYKFRPVDQLVADKSSVPGSTESPK
jgi:AcrR family transcriptional regulator/uncharacterized OB-fold protein